MIYEFDRYIDGVLMAEGVTIEQAANFNDAIKRAAYIASKGPRNQTPVLVLKNADEIERLREMIDVINCKIPLDILWDKDGNERPMIDAVNDMVIELIKLRHKLRKIQEASNNGHC